MHNCLCSKVSASDSLAPLMTTDDLHTLWTSEKLTNLLYLLKLCPVDLTRRISDGIILVFLSLFNFLQRGPKHSNDRGQIGFKKSLFAWRANLWTLVGETLLSSSNALVSVSDPWRAFWVDTEPSKGLLPRNMDCFLNYNTIDSLLKTHLLWLLQRLGVWGPYALIFFTYN